MLVTFVNTFRARAGKRPASQLGGRVEYCDVYCTGTLAVIFLPSNRQSVPHIGTDDSTLLPQDFGLMFSLKSLRRKITRSLKRRGLLGTLKRGLKEPFYMISEYRPSRLRWKRKDKEFDRRFGVDTAGTIPLSALDVDDEKWEYGFCYEPTDPKFFKAVVGELPIQYEKFLFIDFGSGKGRVLLLAAEFPFKRILGVEISQRLHQIAERNIRNYRNPAVKCVAVQSLCADAASYRIPDGPAVLYFFNPFQEQIMVKVLSNIEESLRERPREIYIVYRTPLLGALMDQASFLKKVSTEHGYAVYTNIIPAASAG